MGSAMVLVPDWVLVLVLGQVVDTVALVVSLVDEDSLLASDLFPDSMFLAFVAVLYLCGWRSLSFHVIRSPNLVS